MSQSKMVLDFSWTLVDLLSKQIAADVTRDGAPDLVVGILRGGMIPAIVLAHQLGIQHVRGLEVTHPRTGGLNSANTGLPMIRNGESLGSLIGADVLLVDDVASSGDTAAVAADLLSAASRVRTAVVALNTSRWLAGTIHKRPDYVGTECAGRARFPWEKR
jgi:hypoxanthine phosphoribosyltransferase